MKVIVNGVVVETSLFFSDKRNRDVLVLTLYSDGQVSKIYDVPLDDIDSYPLYSVVSVPCRLYEGKKGIGFVYAK